MNNYLLFSYYWAAGSCGGWDDFVNDFETLDAAIEGAIKLNSLNDYHIISLENKEIVKQGRVGPLRREKLNKNE